MTCNFLLFNSGKTEIIVLGLTHLSNRLFNGIVSLGNISLISHSTVRKLEVVFDQALAFESHTKQIFRSAFFHLCNIANVWMM